MLQAPFLMLGMLIMMGQRAAASAERIYEILDEQPTIADRPGAIDLLDCEGDVRFDSSTSRTPRARTPARALRDSTSTSSPGRRSLSSDGREAANRPLSRLLDRFYDVTAGP